jgi:outer membrane protein TolC
MSRLTKWLNFSFTVLILFIAILAQGQNPDRLTLEKAYALAEQNYPVIKQRGLVRQTAAINIDNLGKGWLPQFSVSGQATYQSDVTKVDFSAPGFSLEPLSKDQYKIFAEANQLIFDGGLIKEQKTIQQLNASVEEQKVEVDLYQLKERINQIFLGVLYLDEQQKQVDFTRQDLQTGIKNVEARVQNGVAFKSDLNLLKAELLKADQKTIEMKASRKGLLDMLSLFINQPLADNASLQKPVLSPFLLAGEIQRPELRLFTEQYKLLGQQNNLLRARNLPKASLFLQGGYGRPGLNQLKNGFDTYYIGGLRLNWLLSGFYTNKKEKQLVTINQNLVNVQKETFLLNTQTQLKQQESEVEKLQQLIATDDAIIDLRRQVKESARAQLENGVISANDYLREVNAEDQARQSLVTHQVQLLQAQINYQTIGGKQ